MIHKVTFLVLIIVVVFTQACLGQNGITTEKIPQPFEDYLPAPGDKALFDNGYAVAAMPNLASIDDNYKVTFTSIDRYDPNQTRSLIDSFNNSKKWQVSTEPFIEYSLLNKHTECPQITLHEQEKVITDGASFQIFVYCLLDIIDTDSLGRPYYPDLAAMNTRGAAYRVLRNAWYNSVNKHKITEHSDIVKFAWFERLFMAAKFRTLTQNEKALVTEMIQNKGVLFTAEVFLLNYSVSSFYEANLNYSKEPSVAYKSIFLRGFLINADQKLVNGVKYKLLGKDPIGYVLTGVTEGNSSLLSNMGIAAESNFTLQYYRPENSTVSYSVAFDVNSNISLFEITTDDESNGEIKALLSSAPAEWPSENITPENPLTSFDFTVTETNEYIDNCQLPKVQKPLNSFEWQKYSYCLFSYSHKLTDYGLEYAAMQNGDSAINFAIDLLTGYRRSNQSIRLKRVSILNKLVAFIRLRPLHNAEQEQLQKILAKYSLEQVSNMLLEAWYFSDAYKSWFDYSQKTYSAMRFFTHEGTLKTSEPLTSPIKIQFIDSTGTVLHEGLSKTDGSFNISWLYKAGITEGQHKVRLSHEKYYYPDIPYRLFKMVQTITKQPINHISTENGGVIINEDSNITIQIQPDSLEDNQMVFNITNENYRRFNSNSQNEYFVFSVSPDYAFKKPVRLKLIISEALQKRLGSSENLALFHVKDNNTLELLKDSEYLSAEGIIQATTTHFSSFALGQCKVIECSGPVQISEMAKVLERRHIEYPTHLPELKKEAEALFEAEGRSKAILNTVQLSEHCNEKYCPPFEKKLALQDFNLGNAYYDENVHIRQIQLLTGKITGIAHLDVQAEVCAINPIASNPQLRLNSIHSVSTNLAATMRLGPVEINYTCTKKNTGCMFFTCMTNNFMGTCTEPMFDHTLSFTVTGHKQQVIKTEDGFVLGPTFYDGTLSLNMPTDFVQARSARANYADKLQEIIKKRLLYSRKILEQKVINELNNFEIKEPYFDNYNCYEPGEPTVEITAFTQGEIISEDTDAVFSDGNQIPAFTDIQFTSNRDADYKVSLNDTCTTDILFSDGIAKGGSAAITINAVDLPVPKVNALRLCVTDKYNGETTIIPFALRKAVKDTICETKTRTVARDQCHTVYYQDCYPVLTGSQKTPGCWCKIPFKGEKCCFCFSGCYQQIYTTQCENKTRQECTTVNVLENYQECNDIWRY